MSNNLFVKVASDVPDLSSTWSLRAIAFIMMESHEEDRLSITGPSFETSVTAHVSNSNQVDHQK